MWGDESGRTVPLPKDWPKIRGRRLKADGHRCTWRLPSGSRCPRKATDVDHIGDPSNHSQSNLRSLCDHHHGKRTAQQGVVARTKKKQKRAVRADVDPGLLG